MRAGAAIALVTIVAASGTAHAGRTSYGWLYGTDINPERMPVETALRISMDAIRAANDRVDSLDHESILASHAAPDRSRGWRESYLIRSRASRPDRLPPLPPFRAR